jgi:hypothetical protein
MRKILVHFKQENIKLQKNIIENNDDLELYKKDYPEFYRIVKNSFKECLNEGQRIIVHLNGSWCVESPGNIDILMYI